VPDPDGVTTFRTYELRPGWVPPIPRGRRCSPGRPMVFDRRLPLPNGQPLHPAGTSHRAEPQMTRPQRRFTQFTRPVFPSPVAPGWNRRPWASTPSFEPRRYQRRTSGWGQASSTGPGLRGRHRSTLQSVSPLILCDLVLTSTLFDDDRVALCADEVPVGSWSRHRDWRSPRCTAGVTVTMRQASTHGPRAGEVHVRRAAASLGALAS